MTIAVFPPAGVSSAVPLAIAQGGTGATTAATARTALGLGTLAVQDASAVAITGGSAQLGGKVTAYWLAAPNAQIDFFYGALQIETKLQTGGTVQVGGNVGVRVAPHPNIGVNLHYASAVGQLGILLTPDSGGAASPIIFARSDGAAYVGSISTTDTTTAYNTTSDVRLKHAVATLEGALARVRALRPVAFRWNADDSYGEGFLAHELMQHVPLAVCGLPDAVNDDGTVLSQQVDHSKLVPWLTAALQATLAQVEALTARVATLEGGMA